MESLLDEESLELESLEDEFLASLELESFLESLPESFELESLLESFASLESPELSDFEDSDAGVFAA